MPRYKLTIAYEGTDFHGWQKQARSASAGVITLAEAAAAQDALGLADEAMAEGTVLRTVQGVVEEAVRSVVREPVELAGASRTDAGVHARGQVAAFTCSGAAAEGEMEAAERSSGRGWPLERGTERLVRAINSRLPEDVLVLGAEAVGEGFNPIRGAVSKGYSYALHVTDRGSGGGGHRPLWDRRFVHHVWVPLDVGRMSEAAARLVGEHDFAAFAAAGHGRLSTVRTVHACAVVEETPDGASRRRDVGRRVRIDVSGSGFLWNMVRIIAGTLVDVGRGRMTPEDVTAAIESGDRRKAGPTLPARGLCLEWIRY